MINVLINNVQMCKCNYQDIISASELAHYLLAH
jgi:hypothetical protein